MRCLVRHRIGRNEIEGSDNARYPKAARFNIDEEISTKARLCRWYVRVCHLQADLGRDTLHFGSRTDMAKPRAMFALPPKSRHWLRVY